MSGVPQDVLSQLFALFSFVTEPSRRLVAAMVVYALVPIPVLFLLRRLSLIHSYKLTSLRYAFRRIWTTQRRRPKQAADSAVRLVEDTAANPFTAGLCWLAATGLSLWWWWSVIDGFDTSSVRADLGQRRPVMFGVPLTPSVRWSVDSDHAVLLVFALCFVLTPILLGRRFRMVHAAVTRSRGRTVPPWYADVRFVVGFSVGIVALIIGDLMVWSRVALLIGIGAEVAISAVLIRTVRLEAVREPSWVAQLSAQSSTKAPAPKSSSAPGSPAVRSLGLPWRPNPERPNPERPNPERPNPERQASGRRPPSIRRPSSRPADPSRGRRSNPRFRSRPRRARPPGSPRDTGRSSAGRTLPRRASCAVGRRRRCRRRRP